MLQNNCVEMLCPQVAKSVKIVETLGFTQVIREKFPVVLVKLLILTNHRPATGNFSLIT